MGFFSWQCKGCDESIKAPYGLTEDTQWKNKVVMQLPNGSFISFEYYGYGRITQPEFELDIEYGSNAEFWHSRCYSDANGPAYTGPSPSADDQGFFDSPAKDNHSQYSWPKPQ